MTKWGEYSKEQADADIAVHAALTTGVHGVGAGVVVGTTLTQTLTNKTLTSPVIQGTVDPGTGLTLPAFTAGGDISLGANKLKTTNYMVVERDTYYGVSVETLAGGFANIGAYVVYANAAFQGNADGAVLAARGVDDNYLQFTARDNGVGPVEIARLQGAADPYFQATLPLRLLPIPTASLPATPVEGMIAYDDTANKLKVYNGTAWETVTSA